MNHDATHCLDFNVFCPKHCYRAQLTAELNTEPFIHMYPMSFAHFEGTEECPGKGKEEKNDK